jgi:hypothetical protein
MLPAEKKTKMDEDHFRPFAIAGLINCNRQAGSKTGDRNPGNNIRSDSVILLRQQCFK